MHLDNAFNIVNELVADFKSNASFFLSHSYQEADVRNDFINKFFIVLGWGTRPDVQKNPGEQEVRVEKPLRIAKARKHADYSFYLATDYRTVKFFVEAKKASQFPLVQPVLNHYTEYASITITFIFFIFIISYLSYFRVRNNSNYPPVLTLIHNRTKGKNYGKSNSSKAYR